MAAARDTCVEVTSVDLPGLPPEVLSAIAAKAAGAAGLDGAPDDVAAAGARTADDVYAELEALGEGALRAAAERIAELEGELRVARERLARAREERFGQRSERSSTLLAGGDCDAAGADAGCGGDADGGDGAPDADAGAEADAGREDADAASDGDADADADAGAEADGSGCGNDGAKGRGGGKGKGAWPAPRKADAGQPRRGRGCSRQEGAVRVTVRKRVGEAELEALRAKGGVTRISDGHYRVIERMDVTVLKDVYYERWRSDATGEVVAADSAGASKPVPNSPIGAGMLAWLIFARFVLSMPATRVALELSHAGCRVTRQTIYRLSTQLALALARPLVARMLQVAVESGKVQSDESWLRVRQSLAETGRRSSVMWLIRTSEALGIPPVVVLAHTGGRAASNLAAMLEGLAGSLMADGYKAYGKLVREMAERVVLVGCLQHARARFADAVQALKGSGEWARLTTERRARLPEVRCLEAFGRVFAEERRMPPPGEPGDDEAREARAVHRRDRVRPALDRLYELVDEYASGPLGQLDGHLGEALRYAADNRERFYAAVDDPDMPLHNSACEREFAHLGVIRANSRQLDSEMGAHTLAQWFSVTRTATANGADELCYLTFILERGPALLRGHGDWKWPGVPREGWRSVDTDELARELAARDLAYLDALMPWGEDFRSYAASWDERRRSGLAELAGLVARSLAS